MPKPLNGNHRGSFGVSDGQSATHSLMSIDLNPTMPRTNIGATSIYSRREGRR
jgi:hypothetical protein